MLDKKQIWVIFLLEFKMGHKAGKTTCNINNTFGPGTANDHSMVVWHFKQTGRQKRSISGCFMSWPQIKKIIIWKCRLLLFNATIIYQSDCDVQQKGNYWLRRQIEKLQSTSQSQSWAKKRSQSLFGGLLLGWYITAFWILAKSLYLRSMLSKSMRCTENCKACSRHWSTERAQFVSMTMSNCMSHHRCFKSWTNWAVKFCLIHHIHLTSRQRTTISSNVMTFCREDASTTSRMQKMLSKSLSNPEAQIFMLQEKQTYLLLAKMYWL